MEAANRQRSENIDVVEEWAQRKSQNASNIGYNRTYLGYYGTDLMAYRAQMLKHFP